MEKWKKVFIGNLVNDALGTYINVSETEQIQLEDLLLDVLGDTFLKEKKVKVSIKNESILIEGIK